MEIRESVFCQCDPKKVISTIWQPVALVEAWHKITTIDVLYQDDAHQELMMTVMRNKVDERNRTVRFLKDPYTINFASIEPPKMMRYHQGSWIATGQSKGCLLTAVRDYQLEEFALSEAGYLDKFDYHSTFVSRIKAILDAIKSRVEEH